MKKLLIMVFIIGGLIMLRPIDAFIKNAVAGIVHRRNLVTGIITADHGNKSYDVEIGESGKSIKKIFTLSPDPDLVVGDKARIFYRGGNKEDLILLAPTKLVVPPPPPPPAVVYISVMYNQSGTYFVDVFDEEGTIVKTFWIPSVASQHQWITMDNSEKIYLTNDGNNIKKYDISGNLLLTKPLGAENWIYSIAIASDGYIYTLESAAWGFDINRRNTGDLEIVFTQNFGGSSLEGLAFDMDGYLYMINGYEDEIEKWNYDPKNKIASRPINSAATAWPCLGVLTDILYGSGGIGGWRGWYIDTDLSSDPISWQDWGQPFAVGILKVTYIMIAGWNSSIGEYVLRKYNSDKGLIWEKKVGSGDSGGYPLAVGSYPF